MKKIFYFASMMLALFMTTSCSNTQDNPVTPPTPEKTTTTITLDGTDYEADVVATFKGEVGQEVSLGLGVYDEFDIYGVDFGDGNIQADTVCYQNLGLRNAEGGEKEGTNHKSYTKFTGTVAGEGNITVYGVNKSDIWYLNCSGNVIPISFDQEKLLRVVQASFSGANVESIELPALECLTQFSFTNSPVKSVDVSKATKLESLSIIYAPTYTGEMNLEAIDVQNNTELTYLSIQAQATGVNAKLKEIDLSKNTKLTSIYLPNNSLEKVTLPADYTSTDPNNPSALAKVTVFLQNNQLTAVDGDLDKLPAKSQINISNNKFTLGTLPALPANVSKSKYTYAPQPAYQVNAAYTENDVLDLSSQLTATGVLTEPVITTFTFLAGTTELKVDEDYKVVDGGKFQFLKSQADPVHAVMSTTAFPNFKNANVYVTTEFTVTVAAASTSIIYALKEGDTFTSGQTVEVEKDVVSITFGETGGADFTAASADTHVEGYTAFTPGNGTNGNKTGGTFYTIAPQKDGTVEVAVALNADKAFYVEEDGTALSDYNGIKVSEKYYGTYSFAVKAGKSYKFYCSGSKLGFYGFKFTY